MKKSLLALAVVFAASSATASAATVYDKDGTTLTVGGRFQSVFYNGYYKKAGETSESDSLLISLSNRLVWAKLVRCSS